MDRISTSTAERRFCVEVAMGVVPLDVARVGLVTGCKVRCTTRGVDCGRHGDGLQLKQHGGNGKLLLPGVA
jgi:hypothetical protein